MSKRRVPTTIRIVTLLICGAIGVNSLHAQASGAGGKPQQRTTIDDLRNRLKQGAKPISAPSTPGQSGATSRPVKPLVLDPATEGGAYAQFMNVVNAIPQDLRNTKLKREEIHALVDRVFELGKKYLDEYEDGENRAEVLYQVAKTISMNQVRYVQEARNAYKKRTGREVTAVQLKQIRDQYLATGLQYLEEAEKRTPSRDLQMRIDKCRGQIFYFGHYFDATIEQYRKVLRDYPEDPEAGTSRTALIGALEKARKFDEGVVECDRFLLQNVATEYAPHVINYRAKLLLYAGRAKETIEHLLKYLPFMEQAYAGKSIDGHPGLVYSAKVRSDFETYLDRVHFQLAFAYFVLANAPEARKQLQASIALLEAKAADQKLSQVGQVFLSRSKRVLDAIDRLFGKPAPELIVPPTGWVAQDLNVAAEKGNVICLLFCPYENQRSEEFMQAVQSFYEQNYARGFRAAWIALPKGRKGYEKQRARVRADAQKLHITFPTVLAETPETVWPPKTFDDYNVAPGTPTLVVIGRDGNIVWYKMDPTFRDFAISALVVERELSK